MCIPGKTVAAGSQNEQLATADAARIEAQLLLMIESHRESCLAKLREATRLILEVAAFTGRDPLAVLAGPAVHADRPLHVVHEAARTFGDDQFTFDDLCQRVREMFPSIQIDRDEVSRRFYDLRQGQSPIVVCIGDTSKSRNRFSPSLVVKQKFYRYRPPK
jgi:hypothetical protein